MKKSLFFVWVFAFITACQPIKQVEVLCGVPESSTALFSSFGKDLSFMNKHDLPAPINFRAEKGKMIEFKTPDGQTAKAFHVPADKKTKNYLFVIHEWWGLNGHIKAEAERLQKELGDVEVLALDLYDGRVATTREKASEYMQSTKAERAQAIIEGAIGHAGKKAKIFTIGWCFGGGWSLQATLIAGAQADGCVIYYGMPEKDVEKLKTLNTEVLGIFASQEQWISPKVVSEFEANMKEAGKKLTVHSFDAQHAFANPTSKSYKETDAQKANELALAFLKERL